MEEPIFLVSNKTGGAVPWAENDNPNIYFSLSDHYWPFQVSSVNRFGIPYSYNASVNLEVRLYNACMNAEASFKRRRNLNEVA